MGHSNEKIFFFNQQSIGDDSLGKGRAFSQIFSSMTTSVVTLHSLWPPCSTISAPDRNRGRRSIVNPRLRETAPSVRKSSVEVVDTREEMSESKLSQEKISLNDLRDNHSGAWETAYQAMWKVGWATARRKLPYDSKEQLEDLLSKVIGNEIVPQIIAPKQEAFVKAMTFEDILNLTSRIMTNRAIDEIRKRVRRPDESDIDKVPEREVATESGESGRGKAEEVHLALAALEERYRVLIEDFYFEELGTAEIAEKRKRPKGSICSDLVKARQMLSEELTRLSV